MPSLDDLKKRIKSVKSTQKITKAMKMVAAAKLRKAQESAEKGRPYSQKMQNIILNLTQSINDPENTPKLLAGTANIGFHPSMTGIQNLFHEGRASIIQGVGYAEQNRSHFRSSDIWTNGSTAINEKSGWLGRYFEKITPNTLLIIQMKIIRTPLL